MTLVSVQGGTTFGQRWPLRPTIVNGHQGLRRTSRSTGTRNPASAAIDKTLETVVTATGAWPARTGTPARAVRQSVAISASTTSRCRGRGSTPRAATPSRTPSIGLSTPIHRGPTTTRPTRGRCRAAGLRSTTRRCRSRSCATWKRHMGAPGWRLRPTLYPFRTVPPWSLSARTPPKTPRTAQKQPWRQNVTPPAAPGATISGRCKA